MKQSFLTLVSAVLLSFGTHTLTAQTTPAVPNGNFESWDGVGASTEEPSNWNSNKTGGGNAGSASQTCYREATNPHGGSYCVKVVSGSTFGVVVNGICTNGKVEAPTFTKSDGYAHTIPNDAAYSSPFTGRPDSLVGWYRYNSSGGDAAKVQVFLHVAGAANPESGNYQGNTTPNIIARAVYISPASSQSTWTRFSVPFVYVDGRTPEYFFGLMTSSADAAGGSSGSTLWVDDLQVIYNPGITTGSVNTGPFYVSASSGASINVPFTLTGTIGSGNVVTAQLSNASGSFANPVNIGSVTSQVSGTISATIPAGTAAGTGYRIRVVMNSPNLTAADNGSNITVNLVSTTIAPNTTQTIAANTAGTALALTENPVANSHEWKYSTTSGGPYNSFNPAQTGNTYTPQFANAGTYYVVAQSSYGTGVLVTSNQVQVNVVKNNISPASPQSLLVGVNGSPISVTETPTGTSREWKYATTSGGPYNSFSPAETGNSYTPVFQSSGLYYVVCQSQISGITATSNEVIVSIGNATINTGTVNGSPFKFSFSANSLPVNVPYTTSGTFNAGNVFTAQLSDSTGSFSNPTNIGTRTATGSGNISAVMQSTTPSGLHYRIRVISSNPVVYGGDNGTDLVVDQFHNSITPADTQNIQYATAGNTLTINESQNATRVWQYSLFSGGPYQNFSPSETGATLTPLFNNIGSYYIICTSQNQYHDLVTSNEVVINVGNGSTLTTDSITSAPFLVSPSANIQFPVTFASDILFGTGNVFTAEMSDGHGSFATPLVIGSITSNTPAPIPVTIPNSTQAGTQYRIRVTASNPATIGTDNGVDLEAIPFELSISPNDTQFLYINQAGTAINIAESQPATREWFYATASGFGYKHFAPIETGSAVVPQFATKGAKYVICKSVNALGDSLTSPEVVILVDDTTTPPVGINEVNVVGNTNVWWQNNNLILDLRDNHMQHPVLQLVNMTGQQVVKQPLNPRNLNSIYTNLATGIYLYQIMDGDQRVIGKTAKE